MGFRGATSIGESGPRGTFMVTRHKGGLLHYALVDTAPRRLVLVSPW